MILQALRNFAEEENLIDSMEVKNRLVHLVLNLRPDGSLEDAAPWTTLTRAIESQSKTKALKIEVGRPLPMPEFPGVNNGGKAYFLADACEKVLGINGLTGDPVSDDPRKGGNATKGFLHFWERIKVARDATDHEDLITLLAFRDRFLLTEELRRELTFVGVVPLGKDGKHTFCALVSNDPVPLDKRTITFSIGTSGLVFDEREQPLHKYWKDAFNRERFAEASATGTSATNRGICLLTGAVDQPIADVHRTLIKGVPGLPPIGGYLVSFDTASPAFRSYGFDGGWNAPISETAAAAYALGLNELLARQEYHRRIGGSVLCAWVDGEAEVTGEISSLFDRPDQNDVKSFLKAFDADGKYHHALDARQFHSATFAANGGRIVVRRWLDQPLREVVEAIKKWFDDLAIVPIEPTRKAEKVVNGKRAQLSSPARESNAPHPLSMYALACTTARVASEVQDGVRDSLYRAAFDPNFAPRSLLPSILQRLRIAATESGNGIRFQTSRFALIKLILKRSESPMPIEPHLCETEDPAYNCGRLLAVLDDLQYASQGDVGADVVARFYGNASTFPRNVFPRLIRLAKHHAGKLGKSASKVGRGYVLERKIHDICARFAPTSASGPPEFPQLLNLQEQGRFALGFHQQKARDEHERQQFFANKVENEAEVKSVESL